MVKKNSEHQQEVHYEKLFKEIKQTKFKHMNA